MATTPTQLLRLLRWFTVGDNTFSTEVIAQKDHVRASIALIHVTTESEDSAIVFAGNAETMRRYSKELHSLVENFDAAIAFAEQK